ncbi:hypothetical protein JCGZ_17469 [Jatropha curcas]|uniref:Uncharacterized protein n=1 Tax=Jatropha curcas TaxID=180498 RepID=A0A067L9P3_JATCU|nr:uncharacterized protein LOC105645091 [Jatropha curcas]KDP45137.1 hypothetical protein JCGZ_17469 [Jatropha curcas]
MKLSLNLQDEDNPRLKAKIPISMFDQPFTSIFSTAANSFSDFSFSVATNFPSGPSLKFTYNPSSTTDAFFSPISLSLKSGLGLFGSPQNSPLVFSANFSLSNSSPNVVIPTFSLHFKPNFGHFSLHKRTSPSSNPNPDSDSGTHLVSESNLDYSSSSNSEFVNGFAPDVPLGWQEVKLEPFTSKDKERSANANPSDIGIGFFADRQLVWRDAKKVGILSGVAVKARTILPLSKRVKVNLRWSVNLPDDWGIKRPYLIVNKIGIERVDKVEEIKENENNSAGDLELLKGMCFWMRRDLDKIERENKDMRRCLEEMRVGVSAKTSRGVSNGVVKNVVPASTDRLGEFEQWRSKKNEGNGRAEPKKPADRATDLESELQKAIKAAAS